MTEDERRRRISMVYDLLLRLAEEKAGGQQVDSPTPPATGEPQGIDAQGRVYFISPYRKKQVEEAGSEEPQLAAS